MQNTIKPRSVLTPLFVAALFSSLACAGAGEMDGTGDEELELGVKTSALIELIDDRPIDVTCVDHTSGGGQRVIGFLSTHMSTATSTNDTLNVRVAAENWKRNIGWGLKRTTQLAIDLNIDGRTWHFDTNGDLRSVISGSIQVPRAAPQTLEVTFHGRDGTSCTL